MYVCDKCGFEIDRDLNAAINMVKVATGMQPVHELSEIDAVCRTLKHCNVEMNIIDRGSRLSGDGEIACPTWARSRVQTV